MDSEKEQQQEQKKADEIHGDSSEQQEPKAKEKEHETEKKYSDAEVNALLNKKFAEWAKKRDAEVDEAKKLAEMNESEKAKYERDKLQKQLDELLAKDQLNKMTKEARSMLSDANITVSDDLLALLVTTDAEKTKAAVNSFATLFKDAVETTVKERLKGNTPKGSKNSGSSALTVDKIMAIKDPIERQEAIIANKELFNLD